MIKNQSANAGDTRDAGFIPGSGRSPGEENGNPLQHSCLGDPTDRGAWQATVHGVRKESDMTEVTSVQFRSVTHVQLFEDPMDPAVCQASLSITSSRSLLKLISIESVMPSNHLILCRPLLLLPSIFPSIRIFSNESFLHIRWPEDHSFSFSISPSNEYSGLISFRMDWLELLAVQGTLGFP